MPYPETAEGFTISDTNKWSDFSKTELKLKQFGDRDIDVAIDACGVCGSDVHTITGGWGDILTPLCVGHEIIGRAIKVGKDVTTVKVGDRVGVGAQVWADLTCDVCKADQENYCPQMVDTYNSKYENGDIAHGGFSSHWRGHEYFVFQIPENIPTAIAAPMLCAGITTYSPLVRLGCGPGKKVAIIGLGGLGHFAVLWASALGAEVTVISHSEDKKEDALKLGAKHFVTNTQEDWNKDLKFKFDFILNAADMTHKFNLSDYFQILKVNGTFHNCGMPDAPLKDLMLQDFASNGCYLGTSHIGNRPEMLAMLELASKQNIKSWVEEIPINESGLKEAVERVKNNKVHYRFTMTEFDKAFGQRG